MSEIIEIIQALRVIAVLALVVLMGLFLYHCFVYKETLKWKKKAVAAVAESSELRDLLTQARSDNHRINLKLKSAKNRLRRNRKKRRHGSDER